ncbi:hypothetical protein E2C01_056699 [Portunus trituberculatus]|uniref:Uncharacterized protein n=1 Tax=Portunus trituberculatus TaxID=210409 RepID=A0A5B7GRI7_PORTR|nr:hypothetical protein [Portunus trituberculatus]
MEDRPGTRVVTVDQAHSWDKPVRGLLPGALGESLAGGDELHLASYPSPHDGMAGSG